VRQIRRVQLVSAAHAQRAVIRRSKQIVDRIVPFASEQQHNLIRPLGDSLYLIATSGDPLLAAGKVDHGFDRASFDELRGRLELFDPQDAALHEAHRGNPARTATIGRGRYRTRSTEAKVPHPFFKVYGTICDGGLHADDQATVLHQRI
jgi:hypothetical protein